MHWQITIHEACTVTKIIFVGNNYCQLDRILKRKNLYKISKKLHQSSHIIYPHRNMISFEHHLKTSLKRIPILLILIAMLDFLSLKL